MFNRSPESEADGVKIFARNYSVAIQIYQMLSLTPGEIRPYKGIDDGDKRYLRQLTVQKQICLKFGTPVLLLQVLSDTLVNGLQGNVEVLENESMRFCNGKVSAIERKTFIFLTKFLV